MDSNHELDEAERRFQEDLEKAKALSLETAALDKFKQEKLKVLVAAVETSREPSPVYATVGLKNVNSSSRSPSAESISPTIQIKPRPRPGGVNSQGAGLVPPPLPKRQLPPSTKSNDLINLMSPVRVQSETSQLEDSFLQELDLAFPNMNVATNKPQRHAIFYPNNQQTLVQNVPQPLTKTGLATPLLSPPTSSHRKLNSQRKGPTSFDDSLFNRNLIDLAVEPNHPRYSILCAFDPLLSSDPVQPEQAVTTVTSTPTSAYEKNKTAEELTFDQDYDPFDYFLGLSQTIKESSSIVPATSIPETIYEVLTKEQSPVKPSSAKTSNHRQSIVFPSQKVRDTSLKIIIDEIDSGSGDLELVTFVNLVRQVRSRYRHDESETNTGYVVSDITFCR